MSELLLSYYGDDFTGSTDALEALASNAVPTVLFLRPPGERLPARFAHCRGVGLAGESRSQTPEWMNERLPAVFRSLKQLGAPLCQYKVCSTFDSSPRHGSIGRALEIGQEVFGNPWVPVAVGAPHLKRYVLFGNLFADGGGAIHRIDRHPTMSRHPVTPMEEGDLRLHLARQTGRTIALLDIDALRNGTADRRLDEILAESPGAVLFDGFDEASLRETGRLLWTRNPAPQSFAVGSAGLTYALIEYWRSAGLIPAEPTPGELKPAERLIVVSGSCSPATERQIRCAMKAGFEAIRVAPESFASAAEQAAAWLAAGRSVVLYTALGPRDCSGSLAGDELGRRLGRMLRELLERTGVRRVVIAGGDTSSHSVQQLGIEALTFAARLTPGAPLCRAHSDDPRLDGLELVLKGGQVGTDDFFDRVLRGTR